jgi:hypothetical protein
MIYNNHSLGGQNVDSHLCAEWLNALLFSEDHD